MEILRLSLVNSLVIAVAVLGHYEVLRQMSIHMPRLRIRYQFRILFGVLGSLVAHVFSVWVFALAYYLMIRHGGFGSISGNAPPDLINCAYFSFITYTSLGYGDLIPVGGLRFLAGLEALTGLVMIAWTASFLYFEMQRYWKEY